MYEDGYKRIVNVDVSSFSLLLYIYISSLKRAIVLGNSHSKDAK